MSLRSILSRWTGTHAEASRKHVRCSFCGRDQDQVAALVAGPSVYICNECVDTAAEIIKEQPAEPSGAR